ncbi:MAG: pilus assembly PilX N-terminal domain-containing protein, partial [Desulfobacterales bacterium]
MRIIPNQNVYRILQLQHQRHLGAAGNVLIYVVVLMLIFGTLGVAMVSLFSSSAASTVARNDTRRAIYMAESGMRYGFSELRTVGLPDHSNDYINNNINSLTYIVTDAGSFTINVFAPIMKTPPTPDEQSLPTDNPLILLPHLGTIPLDFLAETPLNNIYVINYDYVGELASPNIPRDDESAEIDRIVAYSPTFNLDLKDDFNIRKEKQVVFAVKPTQNWTIADGGNGNLFVTPDARSILPRFDGAIEIRKNHLYYEKRIYDLATNSYELTNIVTKNPGSSLPLDVTTSDFVILSDKNFMVIPTGKSVDVEYGGNFEFGNNLAWVNPRALSRTPDITADDLTSNLSEQESDTRFFEVDTVIDELYIGGGQTDEFGSAFFDADLMVGGDQDYCQQGACNFRSGVRAFFLLNFSGQGDGITFTLLGKGFIPPLTPNNSATSAGGDFELSELMGYAGDSRLDAAGTSFLATDPNDRGLDPPKLAVEFDTRTNN